MNPNLNNVRRTPYLIICKITAKIIVLGRLSTLPEQLLVAVLLPQVVANGGKIATISSSNVE